MFQNTVAMLLEYTVADLLVTHCSNDYGDVVAMLHAVAMISYAVASIADYTVAMYAVATKYAL